MYDDILGSKSNTTKEKEIEKQEDDVWAMKSIDCEDDDCDDCDQNCSSDCDPSTTQ